MQQRLLPATLLLTVTYVWSFMLASPFFTITDVRASGVDQASSDEIVRRADAVGTNIFALQTGAVRARVAAMPELESVTVSPRFPNRLDITVVPYIPEAIWRSGGTDYLVTADGFVIEPGKQDGLLRLEDERQVHLAHGDRVDAHMIDAAQQLRHLLDSRHVPASRFLSLLDGTVAVLSPDGWEAYFSLRGDLTFEADVLATLLHRGTRFHLADLRFGASPYYR